MKNLIFTAISTVLAFGTFAEPAATVRMASNIAVRVSHGVATNVVTNVVTKAYVERLGVVGTDTNDVASIIAKYDETNLTSRIAAKQNTITNLQAIITGASKGNTAVQVETDPVFTDALNSGITMVDVNDLVNSKLKANSFTTDGTFTFTSEQNSIDIQNTDVFFSQYSSLVLPTTDSIVFGIYAQTSLTDLLAATNGGAKAYADSMFLEKRNDDELCNIRWEDDGILTISSDGGIYINGELVVLDFGAVRDQDGNHLDCIIDNSVDYRYLELLESNETVIARATSVYNSLTTNTNPTFSNAVLAVGLGIGTNEVAQINAILTESGDTPIGQATTVGGLLVALAAAVAWLRKNKLTKGMTNGQPADPNVSQLFTNNNTLLNTAIDSRLPEVRYAIGGASSATLADRAVNNLTMNDDVTLVFPTAVSGKARDFLLVVDYADGELSLPQGITKVGDSFTMTAGKDYLIAFTEISTNYFFIRSIELS